MADQARCIGMVRVSNSGNGPRVKEGFPERGPFPKI
jgi:hypothetical protein